MTARKIYTAAAARAEKLAAELPALARAEAAQAEAARIAAILTANPAIGTLQTAAGVRFYAYLAGYAAEPTIVKDPAELAG